MTAETDEIMNGDGMASTTGDGIWVTMRELPPAARALLLGVFVNKLAGFLQIFLVLFLTHKGYSATQAGWALGIYGAGAVIGTVVGGSLADRLGPRNATLISMGGSALLLLSLLYLPSYGLLLVAIALVSLIGQIYRPAAQALLMELAPKRRLVMVTAMYRLGLNLGTTAAPLIGAALVSVSYNWLFWGEATAALIYAVIAIAALPKRQVAIPEQAAAGAAAEPAPQPAAGSYRAVLADHRYALFLIAVFFLAVVYCQYTTTLALDISHTGLGVWWYGAVVSINGFMVIAFELLATKITQHWPTRLTVALAFGGTGAGYAIYALPPHAAVFVIGTIVWTSAEIVGAPTVFAYPGLAAPKHLLGRYVGSMQAAYGIGTAVGPVVGAMIWYHVGRSVWLWAAAVAALAVTFGLIAVRPRPAAEPGGEGADAMAAVGPEALATAPVGPETPVLDESASESV
ncbi:MAG: MFS transporter [Frankiaceae bacterium]